MHVAPTNLLLLPLDHTEGIPWFTIKTMLHPFWEIFFPSESPLIVMQIIKINISDYADEEFVSSEHLN